MNPIETTGNDFTRRDFMKKSALTVGALTLLGAGVGLAGTGSGSGSYWIEGTPKGNNPPTAGDSYCWCGDLSANGKTFHAKAAMLTSPANGIDPGTVTITAYLHSWVDGGSVVPKGPITLSGTNSSGSFSSATTPNDPLTPTNTLEQTLDTWTDAGENYAVIARLEITNDIQQTQDREIPCKIQLIETRQGIADPDPVELSAKSTAFSLYVVLKP